MCVEVFASNVGQAGVCLFGGLGVETGIWVFPVCGASWRWRGLVALVVWSLVRGWALSLIRTGGGRCPVFVRVVLVLGAGAGCHVYFLGCLTF